MAKVRFLKGNAANLKSCSLSEGQILIVKDDCSIAVDVSDEERIQIRDGSRVTLSQEKPVEAKKNDVWLEIIE